MVNLCSYILSTLPLISPYEIIMIKYIIDTMRNLRYLCYQCVYVYFWTNFKKKKKIMSNHNMIFFLTRYLFWKLISENSRATWILSKHKKWVRFVAVTNQMRRERRKTKRKFLKRSAASKQNLKIHLWMILMTVIMN